jgi:hypothetical protein
MKELTITITETIDPQDICDLMVAALEGGINYWCGGAEIVYGEDNCPVGVSPEDAEKVEFASDVIAYGGKLELFDLEDQSESWILDIDKLLEGIKQELQTMGQSFTTMMDNHDADTADRVVQYALFKELVYG